MQGPVADVQRLARVQEVDPVHGQWVFRGHDPCSDECRDQAGVRRRVQQLEQVAGVIPIRVGEPDPAHIGRVDHCAQFVEEGAVGQAQAGVDHDRLRGVQDECVHRQEP